MAGGQSQFKGALPHTNMLGSVLFGLYIAIFWQRTPIAWINKIMITILMLTTYSRTYILIILCCIVLQVMVMFWKQINFAIKGVLITFLALILGDLLLAFGTTILESLISYLPFLARFQTFRFGGNGRQYLQDAFLYTIKTSSILEKLIGDGLAKTYLEAITVEFSHSFTENSFMGIYLLFGLSGVATVIYVLYKLLKMSHGGAEVCIIIIIALSMLTQDTLLSIETGVVMCFSLIAMFCQISVRKE
jgi:hypothetical protein